MERVYKEWLGVRCTRLGKAQGTERESRGKPGGKQVPKKGKHGERRGKTLGKPWESRPQKRESRFWGVAKDPLFASRAICEIAPSHAFIILKKKKAGGKRNDLRQGAEQGAEQITVSRILLHVAEDKRIQAAI